MVASKDDGTSKVYTNSPAVKLMVIPTPDLNDTIMELLLLRSMKDEDDVTLLPNEVKLADTSIPENFMTNDSLSLPVPTYICK